LPWIIITNLVQKKKREKQKEREKKAAEGQRTLQSLGFTISSHSSEDQKRDQLVTSGVETVSERNNDEVNKNSTNDDSGSSNIATCNFSTALTSEPHRSSADKDDVTEVCSASYLTKVIPLMYVMEPHNNENLLNFDIGLLESNITVSEIEDAIRRGPEPSPTILPPDKEGSQFPVYVLNFRSRNNETVPRDWLVWRKINKLCFVFPVVYSANFRKNIVQFSRLKSGGDLLKVIKNFTKYLNMTTVLITEDVMQSSEIYKIILVRTLQLIVYYGKKIQNASMERLITMISPCSFVSCRTWIGF
jgi:hypothetical protein